MPEFFETRMGQKFYDGTMPRIVHALESLATAVETLVVVQTAAASAALAPAKTAAAAPLEFSAELRTLRALLNEAVDIIAAADGDAIPVVTITAWLAAARTFLDREV